MAYGASMAFTKITGNFWLQSDKNKSNSIDKKTNFCIIIVKNSDG